MNMAVHQDRAGRHHRVRFRIGEKIHMRRLALALGTLEELEEAVLLALQANGVENPDRTIVEMRAALKLLAEGPKGEFR